MTELFESSNINGLSINNRFVRSATWEGMAGEDGSSTQRLTDLLVQLAVGGVGLIITGHAYVLKNGQAGPWQLGIHSDNVLSSLLETTSAVHLAGGKIVLQLAHAGCQASYKLTGMQLSGPSFFKTEKGLFCREMTQENLAEVIEAFGKGALRAQKAGFDGVQLHAAHGYLLSQFLSPYFNKRVDNYGGNIQNRARFILAILQRIRAEVGDHFPVLIKINSEDFLEGGFTKEDMIYTAAMLERAGIDAIELSGGTIYSGRFIPVRKSQIGLEGDEAYYLEAAKLYKEKVNVPLILVGGIRSYGIAKNIISSGLADYISLSRPLISEPGLINRWKSGDTRIADCQSDNLCFNPVMKGVGLHCVIKEKMRPKKII